MTAPDERAINVLARALYAAEPLYCGAGGNIPGEVADPVPWRDAGAVEQSLHRARARRAIRWRKP